MKVYRTSHISDSLLKTSLKTKEELDYENAKIQNAKYPSIPDWYTVEMAKSTDPQVLRRIIQEGNNDFVSNNAVLNPACPSDALDFVLSRGQDDLITAHAARHQSCPPSALADYLGMGLTNGIACDIAGINPRCPDEARIKWFYAVRDEIATFNSHQVGELKEEIEQITGQSI